VLGVLLTLLSNIPGVTSFFPPLSVGAGIYVSFFPHGLFLSGPSLDECDGSFFFFRSFLCTAFLPQDPQGPAGAVVRHPLKLSGATPLLELGLTVSSQYFENHLPRSSFALFFLFYCLMYTLACTSLDPRLPPHLPLDFLFHPRIRPPASCRASGTLQVWTLPFSPSVPPCDPRFSSGLPRCSFFGFPF